MDRDPQAGATPSFSSLKLSGKLEEALPKWDEQPVLNYSLDNEYIY